MEYFAGIFVLFLIMFVYFYFMFELIDWGTLIIRMIFSKNSYLRDSFMSGFSAEWIF